MQILKSLRYSFMQVNAGFSYKKSIPGFDLLFQTLTFAVLSQPTGVVTCWQTDTAQAFFKKSEKIKQ